MLAQTVILCGGLGTRLGAATANTPKPLLEVSGRPFLDFLIADAARFGAQKILLLAGHFGEQIHSRYDGASFGAASIRVLIEPEPAGTGGALRFALPHLEPEFILMNGDTWVQTDLCRLCHIWRKSPKAKAQLLLHTVPDARRYGTVEDEGGHVKAFREKAPDPGGVAVSGRINAGVYILRRDIVEAFPSAATVSLEKDVLPALVKRRGVCAAHTDPDSHFIDIGVPESLAQARAELQKWRTRPAIFFDRDGTLNHDTGYTHKAADLRWTEGACEAIRAANEAGLYVFVVTNQSGVARGLYTEEDIMAFHQAMQAQLFEVGAHIDDMVWCPHHTEGTVLEYTTACDSRKPAPGMLLRLMARWPVDPARSVMIGDQASDIAAGEAAGLKTLHYNGGSLERLVTDFLSQDGRTKPCG